MPDADRVPTAAVIALGLTQIIGYGTLYYSFSILASDMASDLGWTTEWIFGVLSAALLAGGLAAPWAGNWMDRFGAGKVMTAGSVLAAAALVACAFAPGKIAFVVALIAVEIASNFVLYSAAFALLVQIRPQAAQRSIIYLTLIGGFASTAFWPLTEALHAEMSWRDVYLLFAGLNLAICLPLHLWLASSASRDRRAASRMPQPVPGTLPQSLRPIGFIVMVAAFCLQNLAGSAILVHMVPLLAGLGLVTTAALVGSVFGPSQVLGRVVNMMFGSYLSPLGLAAGAAALMAIGILILALTAPSVSGAIAFAIVFGMGNGLFSIAVGTLPLSLFGSEGYGRLQGRVMSARLIVSAMAPFALAYAMANVGISTSLLILTLLVVVAVLLFGVIAVLTRRHRIAVGG